MKDDFTSYLITLMVLLAAGGAAWLIINVASTSTASRIGGSEANYNQLQQSILRQ
jgi:hypothetical protein